MAEKERQIHHFVKARSDLEKKQLDESKRMDARREDSKALSGEVSNFDQRIADTEATRLSIDSRLNDALIKHRKQNVPSDSAMSLVNDILAAFSKKLNIEAAIDIATTKATAQLVIGTTDFGQVPLYLLLDLRDRFESLRSKMSPIVELPRGMNWRWSQDYSSFISDQRQAPIVTNIKEMKVLNEPAVGVPYPSNWQPVKEPTERSVMLGISTEATLNNGLHPREKQALIESIDTIIKAITDAISTGNSSPASPSDIGDRLMGIVLSAVMKVRTANINASAGMNAAPPSIPAQPSSAPTS